MNGKGGVISWAALSGAIGVLMAWLAIMNLVIDPLKDRVLVARENAVREIARIDKELQDVRVRLQYLEQRQRTVQ